MPSVSQTHCQMNDGASLNPVGREVPESGKGKGNKLFSCKAYKHVGTLNVRTLRQKEKRIELENIFSKSNLDILCVTDHKIVHEKEKVRFEQLENCTLITTSAWRNSSGAASGGV